MTGALIILLVTAAIGLLLYVTDLKWRRTHRQTGDAASADASGPDNHDDVSPDHHSGICCGRHLVCEKSLSPMPGETAVYYDDEELDRFAGRDADAYSSEEIEEFRNVLLTLLPEDVAGWARSIQLRGITLPTEVRDELFILLDDCR